MFKTYPMRGFKALTDEGEGVFEAIVAVFNNVDRAGDKILPGAFTRTLEAWEAKGRPIPVIFSHEWDNLDAHIGQVAEGKEVDEGLYVKGKLDMDEPFAQRVWKKMKAGTLAEFSFAYDVVKSNLVDNGKDASPRYVNELHDLDLLEVGPCLVGMNPETELIAVKDALLNLKAGARHTTKEYEHIQQIHDLSVALGAKCAEPDADDGGDAEDGDGGEGRTAKRSVKPDGHPPSTLAARLAIDLMENS